MSLQHNATLAEKLAYGDTIDREELIAALQQLSDLCEVLERFDLDTDPVGLDHELTTYLGTQP